MLSATEYSYSEILSDIWFINKATIILINIKKPFFLAVVNVIINIMSFKPHIKILSDVASIAEEARQIIVQDYTNHARSNEKAHDDVKN